MDEMENKKKRKIIIKELCKDIQLELKKIGYDNVTLNDTKQILLTIINVFKINLIENKLLQLYDFGKFEVKDYNYRNHLDGTTGVTKRISFSAYKKFKDEVKEKCK